MDSSNNNLLALVAKINNCRKTIERHVADMDVSLQVTARGSAAFNNAIREGVEYKAQLHQALGFQSLASLPQALSQSVAGALSYNFPRPTPSIGATTPAKRPYDQALDGRQPLAPIDGNKKPLTPISGSKPSAPIFGDKKPLAAGMLQSTFDRNIKELYPAKDQSYEKDQETDKFIPGPWKGHPTTTTSGNTATNKEAAPWKDEQGFIHVGGQPTPPQAAVISATQDLALSRLKLSVNSKYNQTDKHFSHMKESLDTVYRADLYEHLAKSLSTYEGDEDKKKQYCDYTGVEMTWAEGSRQYSLEAIHPFAVAANGLATYHIPPNVLTCTLALNMGKGQWPAIVLPLMAEAARIHNDRAVINFDTFKKRWRWVYDRLTNAMVLTKAFKMKRSHNAIFEEVNTWSPEKQRQFLEASRTGEYLPVVQEQVMAKTREELFAYRASGWTKENGVNWARVYRKLQRTAAIHGGLTEEEFRFYLTIVHNGKRVFFPYHVLCRSQVLEVGWSWDIIYSICCHMAETTTKSCNKHAVKAGLGEDLDGFKVMYGLAAIMSQRIKEVKLQWPNASQEEIAFRTTECFGFPLVPFLCHPLATSIGHLNHGTAMYYGFTNGDEEFDPERHIDLSLCTISVESLFTNKMKWDFHNDYVPDMQEDLVKIPLSHTHYKIDPAVGDSIWKLDITNVGESIPPVPEFNIEMVPIDPWVSNDDAQVHQPEFSCNECGDAEPSPGALIHHYREHHGNSIRKDSTNISKQDEIDAAHWASLTCQVCKKVFPNKRIFAKHARMHRPYEERDLICPICGKAFNRLQELMIHMTGHLEEDDRRIYDCFICGRSFYRLHHLSAHLLIHMQDDEKDWYDCSFCGKAFDRKYSRDIHERDQHVNAGVRFPCEKCGRPYRTLQSLRIHIKTKHSGERPRPFKCGICGKAFHEQRFRDNHIKQVHEGEREYPCDCGCGKSYGYKSTLKKHKERVEKARRKKEIEGDKKFVCSSDDCEKSYKKKSSLLRHKEDQKDRREGKKYVCLKCGTSLNLWSAFQRHKRTCQAVKDEEPDASDDE